MKIIISRKGFDSSFGGVASPILPDGNMMSLPIPGPSFTRYGDISCPFADMGKIVSQLTKNKIRAKSPVHFDPDLNPAHLPRERGWLPSLGQTGRAQGHLAAQKVETGDIFIFFGWFRETEYINNELRFKPKSPDLHVAFGYMQVGEILTLGGKPHVPKVVEQYPWLEGHPHIYGERDANNTLYIATPNLILDGWDSGLSGGGTFDHYQPQLCLTAPNQKSRSLWKTPSWLKPPHEGTALTYHNDTKRWSQDDEGNNLLQSVAKGQEFVTTLDNPAEFNLWLYNLLPKPEKKLTL